MSWHDFTWLGDSAILMPLALLVALWLAWSPQTRTGAIQWVIVFGGGALIVLVSKLAFIGWGIGSARFDFTGFSGHTTFSTSVWPVVLWIVASNRGHAVRMAAVVGGWMLGLMIGVSRLAVDAHSISEVVAGFTLGFGVSAIFLAVRRGRAHAHLRAAQIAWGLAASIALPLLLLGPGAPAPTQGMLEFIAVRLAGTERPFTREDLHRR